MMPRLIETLLSCLLLGDPAASAGSCSTLAACLAKYPSVATEEPGIDPEEDALARAVQRYGPAAIPHLIEMLDSDHENVRTLAGYTLRDIDGLAPEHLPALMKARKNGDGWIPPAIASIGTPEAIDFLVQDLKNDPERDTQVTWALEKLGAKAAPEVARLLQCRRHCNELVFDAAIAVLAEMKDDAAATAPFLLEVANDETLPPESREAAILGIGAIGKAAQSFVPQLLALEATNPSLSGAIGSTLTDIGAKQAVRPLLQLLAQDPFHTLRRIAQLGRNGVAAGPDVMAYLASDRWDVRIEAAVALGSIGYLPARVELEAALEDESDWKLVYGAALALAQLESEQSIAALNRVKASHWYPPVRSAATVAIDHLEAGSLLPQSGDWRYSSAPTSPKPCVRIREKAATPPVAGKLYADQHGAELLEISVKAATPDEKSGIVPRVALQVTNGWLAGTDHGEWGGQLIHYPTLGSRRLVIEENIQDIFKLGQNIVAVTGLAHLSMNDGVLLRVDPDGRGSYTATPWRRLPGAPRSSSLLESGELLVNTLNDGSVIIDGKGNLRMADCLGHPRDG